MTATILTVLAWVVAAILSFIFMIFIAEILAGLRQNKTDSEKIIAARTLAFLIPAHNEAAGIGITIKRLQAGSTDDSRIVIIADNCNDDTALIARSLGAEVFERLNSEHRGKAFALEFGRDKLAQNPPDVVMILDADCALSENSAAHLQNAALNHNAPVQAVNLIRGDLSASPLVQISNFAMLVKNLLRQRGMTRLGGTAILTGTGMAIPWVLFASVQLARDDLAEDMAMGIDFVRAGHTAILVNDAYVWSDAAGQKDALVQRTRWEHGFLTNTKKWALPLIFEGLTKANLAMLLLGLHLLVPPLALLYMVGVIALVLLAITALLVGLTTPFILLACVISLASFATLTAWLFYGRAYLSFASLLRAPLYVLWKIPVYLKFVKDPETRWIRTPRHDED
jgi:cellulose synthase/poly-beta-1,6-N-acetylglucosamine synthase-like glycosyltransferase